MIARPKILLLSTEFGGRVKANLHFDCATIKIPSATFHAEEIEEIISFLRKVKKEMSNLKQGAFDE